MPLVALVCVAAFPWTTHLRAQPIYETEQEFIATGDFDGNGKPDIAIVDKATGRVRVGYRTPGDGFNWLNWFPGGVRSLTGLSVGRVTSVKHDALVLTSADENSTTVFAAVNHYNPTKPVKVPVRNLGPSAVIAVSLGGAGNSSLMDLYVASIYNADPTPFRVALFRNEGQKFTPVAELPVAGEIAHANRLALKSGGPELVMMILRGDKSETFRAEKLESAKPETVLTIAGLPRDTDYVLGSFRGLPLKDLVFYTSGQSEFRVATLAEVGGQLTASPLRTLNFGRPVHSLVTVEGGQRSRLLAVFGDREPAELLEFDAGGAPVSVQKLAGFTNRYLSAAVALPDALILVSVFTNDRPRSAAFYKPYFLKDGTWVAGTGDLLPSLQNHDLWTVPDIHKRIADKRNEQSAADMKAYTNFIPGTEVAYQMVPIPAGEFVMGSPEKEQGRQAGEGPQHRVRISPFWMSRYEVTWEEYLLFQYPDDELKLRKKFPTPEEVNALSDTVTHPSKPHFDMSRGMGKKPKKGGLGFPAISMTQHAANKYCQWLSAKTGHFYRLPTEAEWEYACRAGTTTTWYFGEDGSKLNDHAWYFDNSDSKYQTVGRKLPNPWGLYDMYGNVCEWVLDQYDAEFYRTLQAAGLATNPWNRATKRYPQVVRGGHWDDDAPALRSASRGKSDREWTASDPDRPNSIWHLSDALTVGFRVVRPLAVPGAEEMDKYWNSGVEQD